MHNFYVTIEGHFLMNLFRIYNKEKSVNAGYFNPFVFLYTYGKLQGVNFNPLPRVELNSKSTEIKKSNKIFI